MHVQFAQNLYGRHYHRYNATVLGLFSSASLICGLTREPLLGFVAFLLLIVTARLFTNRLVPDTLAGEGHFPHEVGRFTLMNVAFLGFMGGLIFTAGYFARFVLEQIF